MYHKLRLSKSEKFILSVLLTEGHKFDLEDFNDWNDLVKISSSHLVLPALYSNLKKKNALSKIPKDLKIYLKKIFDINFQRNKKLIVELKLINDLLEKYKIQFVFIKGSSNIISKIYSNIGERMIGDIDILVSEVDCERAFDVLEKNGYSAISDKRFFESRKRHLKRQANKNRIFAIEIHHKVLSRSVNNLIENDILDKREKINGLYVPSKHFQYLINIYNHQINNLGNIYLSFNFKSFYDNSKLYEKRFEEILNNNLINNYLGIYFLFKGKNNKKYKLNLINRIRFNKLRESKNYFNFEKKLISIYSLILNVPSKINEFKINKEYRLYLARKLGLKN